MSREVGDYIEELVTVRGEPTDWDAAVQLIQDALHNLARDRQRLYGPGNMAKFGMHGVVIRSTDKLERLQTMVWSGQDDAGESIEDTAGDLSNYALIGVMLLRDWWGLPMKSLIEEDLH